MHKLLNQFTFVLTCGFNNKGISKTKIIKGNKMKYIIYIDEDTVFQEREGG